MEGNSEQEVQSRLASVQVGVWLTVIVSVGSALYALETWDHPNRALILTIIGLGLTSAPLIRAMPLERIVSGPYRDLFFAAWSIADLVLIGALAGLDGGSSSAYTMLLVLPFLFASLSYPTRLTALVGAAAVAAALILSLGIGGGFPFSGFGLFVGTCIALLAAWEARNQLRQRRALTETAGALARSEESSRLQAHQQSEVARFGQHALEGADIEELAGEACRILTDVLDVDYGGVLKLLPETNELLLVAAVGMPEELVGKARVPADHRYQCGYALATDTAMVVNDWEEETRFQQSELQAEQDTRSASIVLIKGNEEPYGVLAAAAAEHYGFSQEDVNFMQAIANVLANAIERRRTEERTQHDALHDGLPLCGAGSGLLGRADAGASVAGLRPDPSDPCGEPRQ